ncbi:hypothetical protein ACN28S_63455 [Cystobacter fuscus]
MFPTTIAGLAQSPELLNQLRQTATSLSSQARRNPDLINQLNSSPMDAFLSCAPEELRANYPASLKAQANTILQEIEVVKSPQDAVRGFQGGIQLCKIGMWTALVTALGAFIAITQGALIAPLLALDAGILTVLAAITGLSEGAIAAMGTVATFTFSNLVDAVCN